MFKFVAYSIVLYSFKIWPFKFEKSVRKSSCWEKVRSLAINVYNIYNFIPDSWTSEPDTVRWAVESWERRRAENQREAEAALLEPWAVVCWADENRLNSGDWRVERKVKFLGFWVLHLYKCQGGVPFHKTFGKSVISINLKGGIWLHYIVILHYCILHNVIWIQEYIVILSRKVMRLRWRDIFCNFRLW